MAIFHTFFTPPLLKRKHNPLFTHFSKSVQYRKPTKSCFFLRQKSLINLQNLYFDKSGKIMLRKSATNFHSLPKAEEGPRTPLLMNNSDEEDLHGHRQAVLEIGEDEEAPDVLTFPGDWRLMNVLSEFYSSSCAYLILIKAIPTQRKWWLTTHFAEKIYVHT